MLRLLPLLLALLLAVGLQAQTVKEDSMIYTTVEVMPEFPGEDVALIKYLNSVADPRPPKPCDIEGSVYIKFVVEKDGSVGRVEVARGNDKMLNEAALEHIKKMPAWKPGLQNGKPVRVQYVVPIKFALK